MQLRCKEAELRPALLNAADTAQFTDGSEAAPSYQISHLADGSREWFACDDLCDGGQGDAGDDRHVIESEHP
jgi:hypothetical protein